MRILTLVGILLLGIGLLLLYFNDFRWDLRWFYGVLSGLGLGLLIGSTGGYLSKSSAIKRKMKAEELKALRKEKEARGENPTDTPAL